MHTDFDSIHNHHERTVFEAVRSAASDYPHVARDSELLGGVYGFLDVAPKGRNEPPGGNLTAWVRRHDEYAEKP